MKRLLVSLTLLFTLASGARGAVDLSAVRQKLEGSGNADTQKDAAMIAGGQIAAGRIQESLPAKGTFYRMSITPGAKGYPGVTVAFERPMDFSGNDVLAVWFKTDRPVGFFQVVLNSANGVAQELSLAGYAAGFSSRVVPNQWRCALIPYKADRGWVRYGDKLDYARIKSLLFYTDGQTLPADAAVRYEFGGMKLYARQEAKRLAATYLLPRAPKTAAKLLGDKDMLVWSVDPSEKVLNTTTLYKGKIILCDATGMKKEVGIAADVYGFSLPRKTHLKSIQDYEYLWVLNDLISKSPQNGQAYKRLLEVPPDIAADELAHATEPTALLKRRAEIAKAIEELSK
jgi:hypothetical protein